MKKIFFTCTLFALANIVLAQDLTYTVINTATGLNTGSVDLSVSGGVAPFTFSWSGPSGFTATTEDIGGLFYGNYTVTVTDKYCGIAVVTVFVDNDIASHIDENNSYSISVFPNPGGGQVSLVFGKALNNATFKLVNIAGQTVLEEREIDGSSFLFNVSGQAAGIYFIELNNAGTVSRTRFVKN